MKWLWEHDDSKTGEAPKFNITSSSYPVPINRMISKINIISSVGCFYFALIGLVSFVIFLTETSREKELRLRQGLNIVGLTATPYWFSWWLTGFIVAFVAALMTMISGYCFQFELFLNMPFILHFLLYFVFGMSMVIFSFFLTTVINSQRMAYTISYAFVLMAVVMEVILS